jgi:DNA-binding MarR family transcriptional regulator
MGQIEIIDFLSEKKEPLSRMQIAEGLNEDLTKISHLIRKLIDNGDVKYIEVSRFEARSILKEKSPLRRCKLYYI